MKRIGVVGMVLLCLALLLASTSCGNSDGTPPSSPANLAKTTPDDDNTPTFSWDAAADEGSGVGCYVVRILEDPFYQYWIFNGDSTSFACPAPLLDGSYTFEVKAVDKAGNEGAAAALDFIVDTSP